MSKGKNLLEEAAKVVSSAPKKAAKKPEPAPAGLDPAHLCDDHKVAVIKHLMPKVDPNG